MVRQTVQPTFVKTRNTLILPLIARSIETDWSIGVAGSFTFRFNRQDTITRTSNTQVLALYSLRKQFIAAINGTTYFPGERYILNHQLSYSYFPDKFWGLGKEAPLKQEDPTCLGSTTFTCIFSVNFRIASLRGCFTNTSDC